MSSEDQVKLLRRKVDRERCARKSAEQIAEQRSRELFQANQHLAELNRSLQARVDERTVDLQKAKEAAEQANQAKTEFLTMMSHELRTPLNAVLGLTDLVLRMKVEQQPRELLERVYANAESVIHLVNDLLDLAKVESGKFELSHIEFAPRDLFEETVELLWEQASNKSLDLVIDMTTDLPTKVVSDPHRIRQIVTNLLSNGIKYTDRGEVVIEVSFRNDDDRDWLDFVVRDTGRGIPAADIDRVFDRFFRVQRSEPDGPKGTGLGLSLCRSLVALLGGTLSIESEVGTGTQVRVSIPVDVPPDLPRSAPKLEGRTFGVVGLSESNAGALRHLLEQEGANVVVFDFEKPPSSQSVDAVVADSEVLTGTVEENCLLDLPVLVVRGSAIDNKRNIRSSTTAIGKPFRKNRLVGALLDLLCIEADVGVSPPTAISLKPRSRRGRILLVEDNRDNKLILSKLLEAKGYAVDHASNGGEGLMRFSQAQYHCVLTDIGMPCMDGIEMVERVRALERQSRRRRTPIIAVTAHAIDHYRHRAFEAGVDDYVTKPVKRSVLLDALQRWADTRPAVLIVDDDGDNRRLLTAYLENYADVRIVQARDGEEALSVAANEELSLVLLDMWMPRMDGYATARAIRRELGDVHLPIVALTGFTGNQERNRCLEAGCDECLEKPIDRRQLFRFLEQYLGPQSKPVPVGSRKSRPGVLQKELELTDGAQLSASVVDDVRCVDEATAPLIGNYLRRRWQDLRELPGHLDEGDYLSIGRIGHGMRGNGLSFGFPELSTIGGSLEDAAKSEDGAALLQHIDALRRYLEQLRFRTKVGVEQAIRYRDE